MKATRILPQAFTLLLLLGAVAAIDGCAQGGDPSAPEATHGGSSIQRFDGVYEIEAGPTLARAGAFPVGPLHNDALAEFLGDDIGKARAKISDGQEFIDRLQSAANDALQGSGYAPNVEQIHVVQAISFLFEMRDIGGVDAFEAEVNDLNSLEGYLLGASVGLTSVEADWVRGFVETAMAATDQADAHMRVNYYTMMNGIPVPGTELFDFYTVVMHSDAFWTAEDVAKGWRDWGSRICDGLGAFGGGVIGSPGGILGAGGGALIGSLAGSLAFEVLVGELEDMGYFQ